MCIFLILATLLKNVFHIIDLTTDDKKHIFYKILEVGAPLTFILFWIFRWYKRIINSWKDSRKSSTETTKQSQEPDAELENNLQRLNDDPRFLILRTKEYLGEIKNKLLESYYSLETQFRRNYIEPRNNLRNKLQELSRLSEELQNNMELDPEIKKNMTELIEAQLRHCSDLIDSYCPTDEEEETAQELHILKNSLDELSLRISYLETLANDHEQKEKSATYFKERLESLGAEIEKISSTQMRSHIEIREQLGELIAYSNAINEKISGLSLRILAYRQSPVQFLITS